MTNHSLENAWRTGSMIDHTTTFWVNFYCARDRKANIPTTASEQAGTAGQSKYGKQCSQSPCSQSNCKLQQNISGNLIESPLAFGWTEALCSHYVLQFFFHWSKCHFTVLLLIGGFVPGARIEKLLLTLPH